MGIVKWKDIFSGDNNRKGITSNKRKTKHVTTKSMGSSKGEECCETEVEEKPVSLKDNVLQNTLESKGESDCSDDEKIDFEITKDEDISMIANEVSIGDKEVQDT